jgi:hypothetical protein
MPVAGRHQEAGPGRYRTVGARDCQRQALHRVCRKLSFSSTELARLVDTSFQVSLNSRTTAGEFGSGWAGDVTIDGNQFGLPCASRCVKMAYETGQSGTDAQDGTVELNVCTSSSDEENRRWQRK